MKNEKPLQRVDRLFHTVTTTDDPVIRKVSNLYIFILLSLFKDKDIY